MEIITKEEKKDNTGTAIGREEAKYKQKLNNGYRVQKGSKTQFEVIEGLIKYWVIFSILAIIVSALGFYSDLFKIFGFWGAVAGATAAAFALEYFKILAIKGAMSGLEFLSKAILGAFGVILMIVILVFHIKSVNLFGEIQVNQALRAEVNYQRSLDERRAGQIDKLLKSNVEASKALDNGFGGDDKMVSSVTASNNGLIEILSAVESPVDVNALLSSEKAEAELTKGILLGMVLLIEFLALFSIVGMIIRDRNVSSGTKELVTTMDKLGELEANTLDAIQSAMMQKTKTSIEEMVGAVPKQIGETLTNSPTLPPMATEKKEPVLLGLRETLATSPAISHTGPKGEVWSNAKSDTPALPYNTTQIINLGADSPTPTFFNGSYDNFVDAYEGDGFKVQKFPLVPKQKKKPKKTRIVKNIDSFEIVESPALEEQTTENASNVGSTSLGLDLLKFNFVDSQIILAAWDNGTLGVGERLVKKSLVLAELEEQGIKEDNYVTLFRRLKKQNFVVFEMGYIANAKLINGVTSVG